MTTTELYKRNLRFSGLKNMRTQRIKKVAWPPIHSHEGKHTGKWKITSTQPGEKQQANVVWKLYNYFHGKGKFC